MATKNLVPRTAGEGKLGISTKKWEEINALTGSFSNISASGFISASSFVGDGTNITGVTAEWDGTHAGTAEFIGNITGSGNLEIAGNISGSSISTGSFGYLHLGYPLPTSDTNLATGSVWVSGSGGGAASGSGYLMIAGIHG